MILYILLVAGIIYLIYNNINITENFNPIGRMGHTFVNLKPYPIKKDLDDVNGIGNNLLFDGPIIREKLDEICYFKKILKGVTNDKASTDCTTPRLIEIRN